MEMGKMTEQHRWLHQLEGDWLCETEMVMGPDQPSMRSTGRDRVRKIGDFWIIAEGETDDADRGPSRMVMTLGFDPQRERFCGTFVHSMMSYLWQYDGTLDVTRKVLTLASTGPSMTGDGSMARYHDVITLLDGEQRSFASSVEGTDGTWFTFMTARHRRA